MTDTELKAYELEGLRENGEPYTYEVLGLQTEAEANRLAEHYASLWKRRVKLYQVPGAAVVPDGWKPKEMQFVCEVDPPR